VAVFIGCASPDCPIAADELLLEILLEIFLEIFLEILGVRSCSIRDLSGDDNDKRHHQPDIAGQ
jgi:hypothetical protein